MKFKTTSYGMATVNVLDYTDRNAKAIILRTEKGSITLTTNIKGVKLNEGEFIIKTWSENDEVAEDARKSGLFIDTGKRIPTGYVLAEVWKFADQN